jgi:uncharacterized protein (TIGR03437 family)
VQVSITNGSASFTATTTANWITVTPSSGTSSSTVNIGVNTALLSQGQQTGTVTIAAPGATGSPQTIQVTANVTSPPALTLSASQTGFTYRTGDPVPPTQTVQVGSNGAALPFTVTVTSASWLSLTPTSGTTPANLNLAVDPSKVQVGTYSATITVNSTGAASQSFTVTLNVSAPLPTIVEVDNGASMQPGAISPGLVIAITGSALGQDPATGFTLDGDLYPTKINNTRVLVGGYVAAMISSSSTQVWAIVPYEIAGKTSTFVQVEYLGQRSNAMTVQVANTAPGVFAQDGSGQNLGGIRNQDGSVNSGDNPESTGRTVSIYVTGEGVTVPAGTNGKVAGDVLAKPVQEVTASINGVPAVVQYYGAETGKVAGVIRVDILIPPGAGTGDLVVHIGGNDSQPGVPVFIR